MGWHGHHMIFPSCNTPVILDELIGIVTTFYAPQITQKVSSFHTHHQNGLIRSLITTISLFLGQILMKMASQQEICGI